MKYIWPPIIYSLLVLISQEGLAKTYITPDVIVHVGKTAYRTRLTDKTIRTDFSQLGYDLRLKYKNAGIVPFAIIDGYKTFTGKNDDISSSLRYGIGSYYAFNPNNRVYMDVTRTRDKIIMENNGHIYSDRFTLYKAELIGEIKIGSIKQGTLQLIVGAGINTSSEKKIFKFERGEYARAGFRYQIPDQKFKDERTIFELYCDRDAIRGPTLKQERNSLIFRAGREF